MFAVHKSFFNVKDYCRTRRYIKQKLSNLIIDLFNIVVMMSNSRMSSSFLIICTKYNLRLWCQSTFNQIVFKTFYSVPIEYKQELSSFVDQYFIFFVRFTDKLMFARKDVEIFVERKHELIESLQMMVPEVCSVSQVPSSPTIVITPVVAFPRKINPLRMTKFITHEVKISIIS